MRCLPLALLALAPAALLPARPVEAQVDTVFVAASVHPAVVRLGERLSVDLVMALPDSTSRLVGPPAPLTIGDLDVVLSEPVSAGADSAGWHMELALFRPGDVTLEGIPLLLETGTEVVPVRILPFVVSVETVLPDSMAAAEIRDVKPPVAYPLRWRWGRIGFTALLLGLASAGVWFLLRRRGGPWEPVARPRIEIPPETAALLALRELEEEALAARGMLKEHYSRLSLILREYMERRLDFPAVESTTEEIRMALAGPTRVPGKEKNVVLEIFDEADLVKFARLKTEAGPAQEALSRGRAWVERMGPLLKPAPPPAAIPTAVGNGGEGSPAPEETGDAVR